MKEKFKKITNTKYFIAVVLAAVVILQLVNITNIIVNRKKSFHSDEIFSYGLANSFYEPYLDTDGINSIVGENHLHNLNHWISGEVIRNYVTVQDGEQFRYDSVWYNQSMDRHPPLYYSVMHTICSFFPNTFSFVFGYIINFVCFIVTQLFLYKLSRNILKSKYLALIVCIFWGFSTAAIDLTIFIRMYCMLAMWTVIFLYLHSKLLITDGKPFLKQIIPIILMTICGALTQYLFLFMAFVTVVCFCIRYIFKKQFKVFWAYGFSLLGAVTAVMLIFPAYLPNMLSETKHPKTEFFRQFHLCIRYLLDALFPVTKSWLIFWIPTISSIFIAAVIMSLPVLYLFRDRKLVVSLLGKLKNIPASLKSFSMKKTLSKIGERVKKINFMSWVMFLCMITIMSLTSYSIVFSSMFYIDRYLFIIYPITALFIACAIGFVFSWFRYRKQLTAVILLATAIIRLPALGLHYTFSDESDTQSLNAMTDDSECILAAAEYGEMWMMNYLPAGMYNADKIFVTYIGGQEDCKKELESINTDKPIYVFMQTPDFIYFDDETKGYVLEKYNSEKNVLEEYVLTEEEYHQQCVDFYKNLSITKNFEYRGKYTMFSREYSVYRLA